MLKKYTEVVSPPEDMVHTHVYMFSLASYIQNVVVCMERKKNAQAYRLPSYRVVLSPVHVLYCVLLVSCSLYLAHNRFVVFSWLVLFLSMLLIVSDRAFSLQSFFCVLYYCTVNIRFAGLRVKVKGMNSFKAALQIQRGLHPL